MTGTITDLVVAARLGLREAERAIRGQREPEPDLAEFERELARAVATLGDVVSESKWIRMPASEPPWRDTGVTVQPGEYVSVFAAGRTYASRPLDVWVTPKTQLWVRIGESGPIRSSSRNSNTLRADVAGRLYLGNYFPNDWKDSSGARVQDDAVYRSVSGEMVILVVRWRGSALDGLDAMIRAGDPLGAASSERERIAHGPAAPDGWHYLWHLGDAEIFRPFTDPSGAHGLHCETRADVGILQRESPFPLRPDTTLSWRWRVDSLPGVLREDTVPSHDYLSIAVEFENGLDLTYYWSKELPVGSHYWCPLPNWKAREHHVVVRSGSAGLGEWHSERRDLQADAVRYLGAHPGNVVSVWLIAVSIFKRQTGVCAYSDVRLNCGSDERVVL